jgi:hypothetical protein
LIDVDQAIEFEEVRMISECFHEGGIERFFEGDPRGGFGSQRILSGGAEEVIFIVP